MGKKLPHGRPDFRRQPRAGIKVKTFGSSASPGRPVVRLCPLGTWPGDERAAVSDLRTKAAVDGADLLNPELSGKLRPHGRGGRHSRVVSACRLRATSHETAAPITASLSVRPAAPAPGRLMALNLSARSMGLGQRVMAPETARTRSPAASRPRRTPRRMGTTVSSRSCTY